MGSGGVAIAALFIVICLEVPFSDGLGGVIAVVTVPTRGPAQLSNMLSLKQLSIWAAKIQKNIHLGNIL